MTLTTDAGTFELLPWQLEYVIVQRDLLFQALREEWDPRSVYRLAWELTRQLHETHLVEEEREEHEERESFGAHGQTS